jgi:hypothetical protein
MYYCNLLCCTPLSCRDDDNYGCVWQWETFQILSRITRVELLCQTPQREKRFWENHLEPILVFVVVSPLLILRSLHWLIHLPRLPTLLGWIDCLSILNGEFPFACSSSVMCGDLTLRDGNFYGHRPPFLLHKIHRINSTINCICATVI